jgi:hypothetical protein
MMCPETSFGTHERAPSGGHLTQAALEAVAVCIFAAIVVAAVADTRPPLPGAVRRVLTLWPALAIAVAACALRLRLGIRGTANRSWRTELTALLCRLTIVTILAADLALVLGNLVVACGGLDSAGYVGSARLFLSGRLVEYQPIARALPFADATDAVAPLGFVPAASPYFIAPRFPPGLPLVMAASMAIGGSLAPFFVAPAFAAATVAIVFVMTRRTVGSIAAALAAVMVATGPVFLDLSLQPMSDVPATFWLTLAGFLLWRPTPRPALGALAAGMAILTRPPLAVAVVALGVVTRWPDTRRPLMFAGITSAFVVGLLALHAHIFGHPLASGYGSPGQLFTLSALAEQAVLHGKWLLVVYTPLLAVFFAIGARARPRLAWQAAVVFAATAAPYLIYAPRFDHWETSRFLLPGLPFVLIVCASGVTWLVKSDTRPLRAQAATAMAAAAIATASYWFTASHHVFDLEIQEMRYRMVGEWFAKNTPPNAVAIAALHSGSLRIYSGRTTLRVDGIPDGMLLDTLRSLQNAGYVPYAVLEAGGEYEAYARRFRPNTIPALVITPEAMIRGVQIFRLTAR